MTLTGQSSLMTRGDRQEGRIDTSHGGFGESTKPRRIPVHGLNDYAQAGEEVEGIYVSQF
jgi:hypothetical protein